MDIRAEVKKFIKEDGFYDIELGGGRVFTAADERNSDGTMDLMIMENGVEQSVVASWEETTLDKAFTEDELVEMVKKYVQD